MSRIISGKAGGIRLTSVPSQKTRPTTDRVKEALFSRLDSWGLLEDAVVADLYAGSGALGLEALSRGAARTDLVEFHPAAAKVCAQNAGVLCQSAGISKERVKVHRKSVEAFLASPQTHVFDLVLIDPPYSVSNDQIFEILGLLSSHLAQDSTVVLERSGRDPEPSWPKGYQLVDAKNYGETALYYMDYRSPESDQEKPEG